MATAIYYSTTLVPETCYKCGIAFGMPQDFQAHCKRDKHVFYCPNGHGQSYTETTVQEMQRRLNQANDEVERANRRAAASEGSARRAEYRRRHAVGQLTKTKKRIGNGVCPCCNRTFRDLAAHMATKHPEYAAAEES